MFPTATRQSRTALIVYFLILLVTPTLVTASKDHWWRYALVLIPLIPVFYLQRFELQNLARMDELQRKIQLEALVFAYYGTAALVLIYGFLELAGLPKTTMFAAGGALIVLRVIGWYITDRKYQ
jgi:hypothetical protein